MLTLDKIYHASYVLKGHIRYTDLIHSSDICPGTDLYLKTENLQVTGAFKIRGAFYKISQLREMCIRDSIYTNLLPYCILDKLFFS